MIGPNNPNPFFETTDIEVGVASDSLLVSLRVHSLDGSTVATLVDRTLTSGIYAFR